MLYLFSGVSASKDGGDSDQCRVVCVECVAEPPVQGQGGRGGVSGRGRGGVGGGHQQHVDHAGRQCLRVFRSGLRARACEGRRGRVQSLALPRWTSQAAF